MSEKEILPPPDVSATLPATVTGLVKAIGLLAVVMLPPNDTATPGVIVMLLVMMAPAIVRFDPVRETVAKSPANAPIAPVCTVPAPPFKISVRKLPVTS